MLWLDDELSSTELGTVLLKGLNGVLLVSEGDEGETSVSTLVLMVDWETNGLDLADILGEEFFEILT